MFLGPETEATAQDFGTISANIRTSFKLSSTGSRFNLNTGVGAAFAAERGLRLAFATAGHQTGLADYITGEPGFSEPFKERLKENVALMQRLSPLFPPKIASQQIPDLPGFLRLTENAAGAEKESQQRVALCRSGRGVIMGERFSENNMKTESSPHPGKFIAHRRKSGECQTLADHLLEVSELTGRFSAKMELGASGQLIGLLHDVGKYSLAFQQYLCSAVGILDQDVDENYVDPRAKKGKIDHSTAGAQTLWQELAPRGRIESAVGQILAVCIASHHAGLIDCLAVDGTDHFSTRMQKSDPQSHRSEAWKKADKTVREEYEKLIHDRDLLLAFRRTLESICRNEQHEGITRFKVGLLVRFLFSCLIDADRLNTADFARPAVARQRMNDRYEGWPVLSDRLETHLTKLRSVGRIDELRRDVSWHCLAAAERKRGIFTLTVPTGGGKTLASLRFALRHAEQKGMDRVIYVIPYTSIIDQNADAVRKILEPEDVESGSVVLEHHSNLTPEEETWRNKILSENWDAPVIFTTTVQFLETLFGAGTRGARRMHQLANAVIVFDEIQTLPVNCVHLFNNAINFLVEQCRSSVLLCTATQPLLDQVDSRKGALRILRPDSELMPDVKSLFDGLNRVEILDRRKAGGWTSGEVADLALKEVAASGSCLVVVNTKSAARSIYRLCKTLAPDLPIYHLSTHMCPAHRKLRLSEIKTLLKPGANSPVLCVSTHLIEAGVDVDFGAVVRFTAGFDSIAQAAGRCNRHGLRPTGRVHVINPSEDAADMIKDIRIGKQSTERVLHELAADDVDNQNNKMVLSPDTMARYFQYYFFDRKKEMSYSVNADHVGRSDTLLNMLSENIMAVDAAGGAPANYLRQSFMTAAKAFKSIDVPTQGVIVQYADGKRLDGKQVIAELSAAFDVEKQFALLRRAQQYTVNVFPQVMKRLQERNALHEVQEGTGILYLDSRYYDSEFGLSEDPVNLMELQNA
jgi:CRISPR-associated endonuclease/helicase Cas3